MGIEHAGAEARRVFRSRTPLNQGAPTASSPRTGSALAKREGVRDPWVFLSLLAFRRSGNVLGSKVPGTPAPGSSGIEWLK